jgi:hypothetical protein
MHPFHDEVLMLSPLLCLKWMVTIHEHRQPLVCVEVLFGLIENRIPLIMIVYAAPLFCEVIIDREQGEIMPSTVVSPLI